MGHMSPTEELIESSRQLDKRTAKIGEEEDSILSSPRHSRRSPSTLRESNMRMPDVKVVEMSDRDRLMMKK